MGGEINDLALDGLDIDLHGQSLADVLREGVARRKHQAPQIVTG